MLSVAFFGVRKDWALVTHPVFWFKRALPGSLAKLAL